MACSMCITRIIVGLLAFLGFIAGAAEIGSPAVPPLTNAAAVRGLTSEQAARGVTVRLQGIVTFSFNPRSCFVQDSSAGIYVGNGIEGPASKPGDIVLVEGVSDPGDYAPIVKPSRFGLVGHTNLPTPVRVSYADLMAGHQDSQWVEVIGMVRTVDGEAESQRAMKVDMGGGRVTVFLPSGPAPDLARFVDSTVEVRGVCGTWFNKLRQLFGVRLMVPRWEDIIVVGHAPPDVPSQPAQPIGTLLRFAPQGPYGHRVKVAGTVVLQQPGRAMFVQDEQHGLYVQTRQPGKLQPGDRVELVGFPEKGEYTPVLQDAVWRKTGSGPEPTPALVRPDEALSGLRDSQFISVEGTLLDRTHNNQETSLVLEFEGHVFSAHLQSEEPRKELANLQNHSHLRLTGVCRIEVGEDWRAAPDWRAKTFELFLRSPADVQVIALPPWWSLAKLLWAVGVLAAVVLASLLWAALLRRKVRKQTFIIGQKLELEARLKERYRDLFESANDMVYTHDLNGSLTSLNIAGEQLLGMQRADVLNRSLLEFIAAEQRPAAGQWLQEIVKGTGTATAEWDFMTSGGERLRLEASTRLIEHEGKAVEVEGIARDVTERRRLEKEILEISTREQRRIGHDLHDGVCQQLAGIGVLADILADKLDEQTRPEAADARKLTDLLTQANKQTRGVARGLFPVRLEENGLVSALDELAQGAGAFFNTRCEFQCAEPFVLNDQTVALHLYYIVQEAIVNAVKHGKARHIEVRLASANCDGGVLTVRNDGALLAERMPPGPGMGIRIMRYRAKMIGATVTLNPIPGGGAEVICQFVREARNVVTTTMA
jgi:PAS domain S-box-containing protein